MQRYLISYEFTDGEDQEEGAEMLINWYGIRWSPKQTWKLWGSFLDFYGSKWDWTFCSECRFSGDNLEAMASLEKVNGYKYSTVYGSWWVSRIIKKTKNEYTDSLKVFDFQI